jgi:hypothetical protein
LYILLKNNLNKILGRLAMIAIIGMIWQNLAFSGKATLDF